MFFIQGHANKIVDRLLYSAIGQRVVSILLGLGLATLFQKACTDRKCILIQAPPLKDLEKFYYRHGTDCYRYTPYMVPCV